MVEYTWPPIPPISGFMASSLESPADEKEDTVPAVGTDSINSSPFLMTTTGTLLL
jgi:hypothetical protein